MANQVDLRIIPAKMIQEGAVPLPSDFIAIGELISNVVDGRLFIRLADDSVVQIGDLSGVQSAIDGAISQLQQLSQALGNYAPMVHGHTIAQVDGLVEALAGKQPAGNYQPAGSYQPAGDYAPMVHGHAIAQVDGLVEALAGKQPAGNYQPAGSYAPLAGVTGPFTVGGNLLSNVLQSSNHIIAGTQYRIGTTAVIRVPQQQGWQTPSGAQSTATFNSGTITLGELAKRVAAIQANLIYHGLLSSQGTTIL